MGTHGDSMIFFNGAVSDGLHKKHGDLLPNVFLTLTRPGYFGSSYGRGKGGGGSLTLTRLGYFWSSYGGGGGGVEAL